MRLPTNYSRGQRARLGTDGQGETNTVMGATVPASPNAGWNQTKLRRCDHAAAQLAYDLDNFAGPYGACFDHIVGHGTVGLFTTATVAAASYGQCVGYGQTVTGRIAVKTTADYGRLSDNPLEGRVVRFDRRPVGGSWTLNVASVTAIYAHQGDNWTKSFSSPGGAGTWEYRAHFDGDVALDPSNKPTFTITWSSAC